MQLLPLHGSDVLKRHVPILMSITFGRSSDHYKLHFTELIKCLDYHEFIDKSLLRREDVCSELLSEHWIAQRNRNLNNSRSSENDTAATTTTTDVGPTSDPTNNLAEDEATNENNTATSVAATAVSATSTTYEPVSNNTRSQRGDEWICHTCGHVNPLCNAFCTGIITRNEFCCASPEDSFAGVPGSNTLKATATQKKKIGTSIDVYWCP